MHEPVVMSRNVVLKMLSLILIGGSIFASCRKQIAVQSIPNVPVNYTIYDNSAQAIKLAKEGMLSITNVEVANTAIGYGGLLVVSRTITPSAEDLAYDLSCPYEVKQDVRVRNSTDNSFAVRCPVCGSVFNVAENGGAPIAGPAASSNSPRRMRQYRVIRQPDGIRIIN